MEEITVRDNNFEVLKVIEDPGHLAKAQEVWESLFPITELPPPDWTHKIDIKSGPHAGRWLYNSDGFIGLLNKRLKPRYRAPNVDLFNEVFLGGVTRETPSPD